MRRRARRSWSALAALGVLLALAAAPLGAHPLHTTLTELTWSPRERVVQISMRVFADDFSAAVAEHASRRGAAAGSGDAAAFDYVRSTLTLVGRDGRALPLQWCGMRRADDLLWLCLRAAAPRGIGGVRLANRVLCERFDDQVNIVQATIDGRRRSLLFTRRDGAKPLT